jgi:hypothetical protein
LKHLPATRQFTVRNSAWIKASEGPVFETAVRTNPQTVAKVSQTPKGRPFSEAAFLTL